MRYVFFAGLLLSTVASVASAQESGSMRKSLANEWPASASVPVATAAPAGIVTPPAPPTQYKARDGEVIESIGGDAIPALPLTVFTARSVKYVTGGIGDEEMAQLKSIENDFNLRVLIASASGVYMGDCTVRVLDSQGAEVITVGDAGPYFYASLEPGTYTVQVTTAGGAVNKATTKVPNAVGQRVVVRF